MRGLLIVDIPEVQSIWEACLKEVLGEERELVVKKRAELASQRQLLDVIQEGYDFVMLPLTLRNYNSLRLAELAYRLESPSRIILCSSTNADPDALNRVFDAYVPTDQFSNSAIRKAIFSETGRTADPRSLDQALDRVLQTASCFRIEHFHGDLQSNIQRYRQSAETAPTARTRSDHEYASQAEERTALEKHRLGESRRLLTSVAVGVCLSGTIIASLGVFFVYLGATGDTSFTFFGQEFSSSNVGIAAVFIGGALIVLTVRRVLRAIERLLSGDSPAA